MTVMRINPAELARPSGFSHAVSVTGGRMVFLAGQTGVAVTLVLWNQALDVERIQRRLGIRQPIVEVFSNDARLANLADWKADEPAA